MSLASDIAPTRTGEGRYAIELSDAWNFRKPSGGVLTSCALSAARAEIDDAGFGLLSATATFVEPLDAGALTAEVEVLRRGRSAAQVRVELRGAGSAGLCATATFARDRDVPGFDLLIAEAPEATPPGDGSDIEPRAPFFENLETRDALATDRAVGRWFRYKEPPVAGDHLDPLAIPPIADTMPAALWHVKQPGVRFYAPSLDLTVHFLEPAPVGWLLVKSVVRWAGRGYATGEAEIWSESGRLIAFATQTMLIARPR